MTTETKRYAVNAQLDIEQILSEARHRWLRPAEICEILSNYNKFRICSEPPDRPPNGSLFLFDRKVLRYFRKDGHSWRKKKDGKTVKEAHERLKAGSIDVLHCYYAHGEENENFQRRSYWMLEEELSHIVFVHYREVKGNRTNINRTRDDESSDFQQPERNTSNSDVDSSVPSGYQSYNFQGAPRVTDTASINSSLMPDYEDVDSAYHLQASLGLHSFHKLPLPVSQKMENASVPYYPVLTQDVYQGQFSTLPGKSIESVGQGEHHNNPVDGGLIYELHQDLQYPSWKKVQGSDSADHSSVSFQPLLSTTQPSMTDMLLGQNHEFGTHFAGVDVWQQTSKFDSAPLSEWSEDQKPIQSLLNENPSQLSYLMGFDNVRRCEQSRQMLQNDVQASTLNYTGNFLTTELDGNLNSEAKAILPILRQHQLDVISREGLKKLDSFDRWMSRELGDVTETRMKHGSSLSWETVGPEVGVDDSGVSTDVTVENYILGPSLSQDQLFSILSFTPNWAYAGSEIKVFIYGRFLGSQEMMYKWACMFGELEVPAEVIADGVLCCYTPLQEAGRVPFYVTCSNRLACSEVREFEFRSSTVQNTDVTDLDSSGFSETMLYTRFGKLLSISLVNSQPSTPSYKAETSQHCSKISALLKDESDWEQMYPTELDEFSGDKVKDMHLQNLLKEKLHPWLLSKVIDGGKGPSVLDEGGQGVLHFAAALGYDWAIPPTIAAGVSVNFRDANGWTALHWAAHFGRERTVAFLTALGALPGALTDPTPMYPSGRTPADLASSNGHKGIAGYLAESSLSSHLSSLRLKDFKESDGVVKGVEEVSERFATPVGVDDVPQGLSLKDSLAAVRNATQASSRIFEMLRLQSFQRKKVEEYGESEFGISNDHAIALATKKNRKAGQHHEPVHAAAVRIQNKFRSYKVRKDYLLIRKQIIKIQALVRGHQVRKNYRKIIWSVGILDKVILRWRRKGKGLSGFKPATPMASDSIQVKSVEDDYDFLKEGRKQTEERLQKALARVKSMVQYPEARDQYRRLLSVVSEMQEKKAAYDRVVNNTDIDIDDDLLDLDALLEEDIFMSSSS